jgi:hypothetical protein
MHSDIAGAHLVLPADGFALFASTVYQPCYSFFFLSRNNRPPYISRSRRNVNLAGLRANRRRPRHLSGTVGTAYAYVRKGKSGQPTSGSGEPPPHYSVSDSNVSATFPLAYTSHQIIQISKCMRNTNDAPIKSMDTFVSPAL